MGAVLEIAGGTLRSGGVSALAGLDLEVASDAVLSVAGPNGSGKSSLINVLTGHHRAAESISLEGQRIDHFPPPDRARRGMVRTFQTPRVYARMSVVENIRAALHATRPLICGRYERRREAQRIGNSLALFGLELARTTSPTA